MAKKNNQRGKGPREEKEFQEEVLQIDRVTRVVKGGRRLRFRATVIVGDRKGKVGVGIGKATEVAAAIQKAITKAKKSLIYIPSIEGDTILHEVKTKYKSALIMIMPAAPGTGIVAGGATRKILDLAGIKNVLGKSFRSSNRVVNAQATMRALLRLPNVEQRVIRKAPVKKDTRDNRRSAPTKPAPKKVAAQ